MSASERKPQNRQHAPAASVPHPPVLSMRDLLASCAAASAVSTPPRERPRAGETDEARRDAA
ncbi:hypothetical protein HW130_07590 [Streptomyces sp. PKU-EA00015]|uniref:hypothetical protein n=1 Tax=Streptomyces sp. PKU-EA00015 TaxID=2748326 RepID=UPI0015A3D829|nr:hypothetical protein [Streptomyces sp. PKU-EA00015]NWF26132.1 hypothetical protein [Streptomyces sp. PKU-EA00015]